jgi:DNA-binding transcriptional LysR family regulator
MDHRLVSTSKFNGKKMDRLEQYRVFIKVAELGSFIKAARLLGIPRASISAGVQQLENTLGTRLLHRTTRNVTLTSDGTELLERVSALLSDADDIDQLFHARQRQISGRLNIDAPTRIARRLIAPALPGLLRTYPGLQLGLGSSDRLTDLVQEGVDCAVRVGILSDSSLVVKRLGQITMINCASPDYLREYGVPTNPADLTRGHWSVGYGLSSTGTENSWEIAGSKPELQLPSRVIANNAESYIACCVAGLGLIQIPRFDVQHLLDSGSLIEVMAQFRAPSMPISLVYPHRRQRSRGLIAFIEWFEALVKRHLE